MRTDDLHDAIGLVDEKLIEEAGSSRRVVRRGRRRWMQWVAIAACFCLTVACVLSLPYLKPQGPSGASTPSASDTGLSEQPVQVLAEAIYPDSTARAPSRIEYMDLNVGEGMPVFYEAVMKQFLAGNEGENRVFSPLNVYMGLSVLAEVTDGESREEILTLLGVKDIQALRQKANLLWEHNYEYVWNDTRYGMLQLANSLWTKNGVDYNTDALKTLAENYYASAFAGDMGAEDYTNKLRDWLNEQTGGILKDQVGDVSLDPNTVLSLVSTIYFGADWVDSFEPERTTKDVFHAASGDVSLDFMHQDKFGTAYVGDGCKSISLPLGSGYRMVLILPNEDVSVNALLASKEWSDAVLRKNAIFKEEPSYWDIQLSLPKFDVSGDVDLADGLKALGITSMFDSQKADFSPILADYSDMAVSTIQHAARVTVDEDGCTAAAFMKSDLSMGAPESNGVLMMDFNRPFIFCITGVMDDMLFAGVVEQP